MIAGAKLNVFGIGKVTIGGTAPGIVVTNSHVIPNISQTYTSYGGVPLMDNMSILDANYINKML